VCSKEFAGGVHLPLDYERVAVGAIADKASIFKSALQALTPCRDSLWESNRIACYSQLHSFTSAG
jgi:hypothetical protein